MSDNLPGQRRQTKRKPADHKLPFQRPGVHCNARLHRGVGYCEEPAGAGTNHPGIGRCRMHGGLSPQHEGVDGPHDLFRAAGLDVIINLAETMTKNDAEYLMEVGNNALVVTRAGIVARLQNPLVSSKEMNELTQALNRIDALIARYPEEENPDATPNTPDTALNDEMARLAALDTKEKP